MTTQTPIARPSLTGALQCKRVEIAILVCMLAVYFFSYFQRVAVPGTVFDEIQATFGVTATAVTALGAFSCIFTAASSSSWGCSPTVSALSACCWTGAFTADGAKLYPPEAYRIIFLVCFGLGVFAFLLSLFLRETRGKPLFAK